MLAVSASCQEVRTVKVTVIEENGTPIVDVDASVLLVDSQQTRRISGKTDANGVFKMRGAAQLYMCVSLEKSDYYSTFVDRLNRKKNHDVTWQFALTDQQDQQHLLEFFRYF